MSHSGDSAADHVPQPAAPEECSPPEPRSGPRINPAPAAERHKNKAHGVSRGNLANKTSLKGAKERECRRTRGCCRPRTVLLEQARRERPSFIEHQDFTWGGPNKPTGVSTAPAPRSPHSTPPVSPQTSEPSNYTRTRSEYGS